MAPGDYLKRRRCVAGYSIRALTADLMVADQFGRRQSYRDIFRIQLRLIDAEAGAIILPPPQAEVLCGFIHADPAIYRDLVDWAEGRAERPAYRLCRSCAASDSRPGRVPFSGLPGRAFNWAREDLCSACAEIEGEVGRSQPCPPSLVRIVEDPVAIRPLFSRGHN